MVGLLRGGKASKWAWTSDAIRDANGTAVDDTLDIKNALTEIKKRNRRIDYHYSRYDYQATSEAQSQVNEWF